MGDTDRQFLLRAIHLAMHGRGGVEPNPMVGCVIAKNDRIIGEGIHSHYGGPHAEPTALAACSEDPRGATAYVTLEPCCHLNKQTPPCVPRLVDAKIGRVVVGCLDPNPDVNGRGIAMLKEAGIQVDAPILEADCKQLIAPFIARTVFRRPYVTLKWAQTADGKIAGAGGQRMQISKARSTAAVHRLRSRCDAILVGINTVLSDDPELTVRGVKTSRPLLRCVLDRTLRTPVDSKLVRTAKDLPVIIACDAKAVNSLPAEQLRSLGVELMPTQGIADFLKALYVRRISHLLVESGPMLAKAFFDEGLADRLWIFRSARSMNDASAPAAAAASSRFCESGTADFDGDQLTEYLNQDSAVYFSCAASADLELERGLAVSPTG